jgi:TolB-like protein/tetratricopeptide (TPR) repeat protein
MQATGWLHNLFEELKRRRVFRVATLYVVALWPIIQIADILSPALDLPASSMRFLLILFVSGFPIILLLAWMFNLNAAGISFTGFGGASTENDDEALIGKNTELLVVAVLLVLALLLFGIQSNLIPFTDTAKEQTTNRNTTSIQQAATTQSNIQSIAVLPFAIFSEDSQDRFFADGLTEELLNVLSRVRNLRVAARTSSFAYKGVNKNIQLIGKELNVGTILEGSVRRNDIDDTVRVTAQLIEVATGTHLWSETFDKEFRDIFKIQDEIAASVVSHLKVTLLGEETEQIKSRSSASPEAMVAHSMGKTELAKRTRVALRDAIRFFDKAIALDANYAEAYSGLADAYSLLHSYSDKSVEGPLIKAQQAVNKALELDNTLGSAWASQGLLYMQNKQNDDAIIALKKAMEINPSYAMAYMWYGSLVENSEERTELYRKAFELDPRSPVAGYNLASGLIAQGRESEAMDIFSQIVEADPFYPGAYKLIAGINEYRGRLDEAIIQYKKVYDLEESNETAASIAQIYLDLGDFENADIWLSHAGKMLPAEYQSELNWLSVESWIARGDKEQAEMILRPMLEVSDKSPESFYDAAYAAFLLGDYQVTTRHFESGQDIEASNGMISTHFRKTDAAIGAAFAYKELGRVEESRALLTKVDEKLDAMIAKSLRLDPETWYRKAEVYATLGNNQMSLVYLQRAVDEGWRQHWRPFIDPSLSTILENVNFKSMMAGLETRMNLMREQLAFEESFRDQWQG